MVCKDIACLLPIRSDGDIVYKHLLYYYNLGCRNFYILNHCGTKEDKSEVQRFRNDSKCNVVLIEDNDPTYNQDKHYALLSKTAKDYKWHVMSDTDEILILKKHKTLQQFFSSITKDIVLFEWYDYVDIVEDDMFEWSHRISKPKEWTKAAMRYKPPLSWSWGHHHINNGNSIYKPKSDEAFYGHFILRDFEKWKQRRIDFADAKYKRFGNDGWWLGQCKYNEIKKDSEYLDKEWLKLKSKFFSEDLVFDPVNKDLFNPIRRV